MEEFIITFDPKTNHVHVQIDGNTRSFTGNSSGDILQRAASALNEIADDLNSDPNNTTKLVQFEIQKEKLEALVRLHNQPNPAIAGMADLISQNALKNLDLEIGDLEVDAEQAARAEVLILQYLVAHGLPLTNESIGDALDAIGYDALVGVVVDQCFLSGSSISLFDGSSKPIEQIEVGDVVLAYDREGTLRPGHVTRTFVKDVEHVLDFFGTGMTPGHVTLCGDGKFAGQYVPIMDILRSDGAIVREDGTLVRAATCCDVCSEGRCCTDQVARRTRPTQDGFHAVRSKWGRPSCVIRLRILTPILASVF